MNAIKYITSAVYGCIIGNWITTIFRTLVHTGGGEHRFVVLAQLETGDFVKVLETDSESIALDFENRIDEDTELMTGFVFDRLYPGDKNELGEIKIVDPVPQDIQQRDMLLGILHEARKYW